MKWFIYEFVHGMTFDEFRQDYKTTYAVYKALENIGEAVKKKWQACGIF